MAVDAVQLPASIERGARGGPRFNTTVFEGATGVEQRNINWTRQVARWDISYGIKNAADLLEVRKLFWAQMGRGYGFLFKDWSDYQDEGLGMVRTIAGVTRLVKEYGTGTRTFQRKITRPVSGTITLAGGGTVSATTGIVTGGTVGTAWTGEFLVPVRFDTDALGIETLIGGTGGLQAIPAIPIVEIIE